MKRIVAVPLLVLSCYAAYMTSLVIDYYPQKHEPEITAEVITVEQPVALPIIITVPEPAKPEEQITTAKLLGTFKLTFYAPDIPGMGTVTKSGEPLQPWLTAATVRKDGIPLGSYIYIEDYGIFKVTDTLGPKSLGKRLDICVSSMHEAIEYGVDAKKVYLLEETDDYK